MARVITAVVLQAIRAGSLAIRDLVLLAMGVRPMGILAIMAAYEAIPVLVVITGAMVDMEDMVVIAEATAAVIAAMDAID